MVQSYHSRSKSMRSRELWFMIGCGVGFWSNGEPPVWHQLTIEILSDSILVSRNQKWRTEVIPNWPIQISTGSESVLEPANIRRSLVLSILSSLRLVLVRIVRIFTDCPRSPGSVLSVFRLSGLSPLRGRWGRQNSATLHSVTFRFAPLHSVPLRSVLPAPPPAPLPIALLTSKLRSRIPPIWPIRKDPTNPYENQTPSGQYRQNLSILGNDRISW